MSVAGKILRRLILNRLIAHVAKIELIPESQCGFVTGKSTTDSSFSLQQLPEKSDCKTKIYTWYSLISLRPLTQ